MSSPPSKQVLREQLGFASDAELARYFGISTSAVAQWPEDQPVPKLRWLEVLTRRPQAGPTDGGGTADDAQARVA